MPIEVRKIRGDVQEPEAQRKEHQRDERPVMVGVCSRVDQDRPRLGALSRTAAQIFRRANDIR